MDSLLETIDSLRLLQKNYETDTELFNFDYREELVQMAVERDRIFTLNKFAKNPDEMLGDQWGLYDQGNAMNEIDKKPIQEAKPVHNVMLQKGAVSVPPQQLAQLEALGEASDDEMPIVPMKTSYPQAEIPNKF